MDLLAATVASLELQLRVQPISKAIWEATSKHSEVLSREWDINDIRLDRATRLKRLEEIVAELNKPAA